MIDEYIERAFDLCVVPERVHLARVIGWSEAHLVTGDTLNQQLSRFPVI
jgi:hypothetical protein